jgi:hypothetical protein
MISVLDMLRSRLGGSGQSDRVMEDMLRGTLQPAPSEADRRLQAMGQNLPEYLPEQVWSSILNKPMYDEGSVIPFSPNASSTRYQTEGSPLFQQELQARPQFGGPQREQALVNDIGLGDYIKREGVWAAPEADIWSSRPPGQSPFASPLNQLMQLGRRAPLSMY